MVRIKKRQKKHTIKDINEEYFEQNNELKTIRKIRNDSHYYFHLLPKEIFGEIVIQLNMLIKFRYITQWASNYILYNVLFNHCILKVQPKHCIYSKPRYYHMDFYIDCNRILYSNNDSNELIELMNNYIELKDRRNYESYTYDFIQLCVIKPRESKLHIILYLYDIYFKHMIFITIILVFIFIYNYINIFVSLLLTYILFFPITYYIKEFSYTLKMMVKNYK